MLTDTDWIMHAKATRGMASRSLRQGETEVAQRLFQAATQMENIARMAASNPNTGNVVKLTTMTEIVRQDLAKADHSRADASRKLSNAS